VLPSDEERAQDAIASIAGKSCSLLIVSAILFDPGTLNATTQTMCWCVIFFFASAAASAAYLTVSEIFPVEGKAGSGGLNTSSARRPQVAGI
jgi:hypothetical protein